jgi:hypothetical protein
VSSRFDFRRVESKVKPGNVFKKRQSKRHTPCGEKIRVGLRSIAAAAQSSRAERLSS